VSKREFGTSRRGPRSLLLALVLGLPLGARAQATDPLSDFDPATTRSAETRAAGDNEELATVVQLRETQDARATCNQLVDDVNSLAALWDQVRARVLDRETLGLELREADVRWEKHRAQCLLARGELQEFALTTRTLTWEVEQIQLVWEPLQELCRSWIDEKPRSEIDAAAGRYLDQLSAYGSWLDRHALFWDDAWLRPQQGPRSCLDDARQTAQELASEIRSQMVLSPSKRIEAEVLALANSRRAIEKSINESCRDTPTLTAIQHVELDLLVALLKAYGKSIDGLRSGDSQALEEAMKREQALIARLVRCRAEHEIDPELASDSCQPRSP